MIIRNPGDEAISIVPNDILAETDSYRLYLGRGECTADAMLCRVVKDKALNGKMFTEYRLLGKLKALSDELETERIAKQGDDGRKIHYDWLFPVCVQSFSVSELDGRRVNVFRILNASMDEFIPFAKLKASVKVDAKSAAWVLGRFLKLQAFLDESKSCHCFDFNPDMVLVAPKTHRVVYLGWFDELVSGGDRSTERSELISRLNINRMFDVIYSWVEKNDEPGEDEFLNWLKESLGRFVSGFEAHVAYYNFLDELWGCGYHPFTFNKDGVWKSTKNYV